MNPNQRDIGLDVIKGVAALLVCMLHFLHADFGTINENAVYVPNINKILYGLCACSVPLFFLVNGTLMLHRSLTAKKILLKIFNLLKIRFIWGILLGLVICELKNCTISLSNILSNSFYLWFFEALAVIYMFLLLWNSIKDYKWSVTIPIALLIFPFLFNLLGLGIAAFTGVSMGNLGHTGFYRLYGILYFIIPTYIDRVKIPQKVNIMMVLVGMGIIAFEVFVWSNIEGQIYEGMNACFPTIGALLITVGLYSALRQFKFRSRNLIVRYFAWTGCNSFGIYLFHMPIIVLLNVFIHTIVFNILLNIIICLLISALCVYLYRIMKSIALINWCFKI